MFYFGLTKIKEPGINVVHPIACIYVIECSVIPTFKAPDGMTAGYLRDCLSLVISIYLSHKIQLERYVVVPASQGILSTRI